jgi:hypothetical protein
MEEKNGPSKQDRKRLSILITNNTLGMPAGSECYARDIARFLIKQGHTVIAYSTMLGQIANELTSMGATVVDSLDKLETRPDIIHGQHHMDTLTALLYFPGVPVVHFIHGLLPWEEHPLPDLSCIVSVVLVSQFLRDRLLENGLISESKVRIIPNFVDESRFTQKHQSATDRKDLNILIYGNYKPKELGAICKASTILNAKLDMIGAWSPSGSQSDPEDFLPRYDVVFAYGKSAMEALFSGCDVILCHSTGTGDLVDDYNFKNHRNKNFGFSCCQKQQGVTSIVNMLTRVSDSKTRNEAVLSSAFRDSLSASHQLPALEDLYYEALDLYESDSSDMASSQQQDMRLIGGHVALMKRRYCQVNSELHQATAGIANIKEEAMQARVEADANLAKIKEEATQARAEAEEFSNTLKIIRGSSSWQITFPLRAVTSWIRNLRS